MNFRFPLAATLAAASSFSQAHERFFVFTYDWFTPAKFERELELTYDQFRTGSGFGQIEFEYGVTPRFVIAPYILLEREDGATKIAGFQLEQRYRFGKLAYRRVLPAAYFEVHKENRSAYELEGKLIASYMPTPAWIVSGNAILEQRVVKGARFEPGYAVGIARILPSMTAGVEAKGNFLANEHIIGPTLGFSTGPGTKLSLGAAFSIGKGDASRLRLLFEREF